MIRFQRTAVPRLGRFPQAVQWAKGLAGYVKEKYDVKVSVFAESNGTIHWIVDYPDYETFGKVRTATLSDSEYWGHLGRAAELFIEGSMDDLTLSRIE